MAKHKVYKTNPARKYIILSLFIFFFLGMGYSILSTSLSVSGSVNVSEYDQTLYGVLEREAKKGTYAKTYTGTHQDSMDASLSNKDVYYWYGSSSNNSTILDSWNVIFADHCWQMFRTTDTGGVKLLYNGEVVDNKCLNTRSNHIGYSGNSFQNLSSNYWYGNEYNYDNGTFSLSGEKIQSIWNDSTYESLIGKYTCKSTSSDGTCSTLYYVDAYDSSSYARTITLNSNSNYSQFGSLPFNYDSKSIAYIGYMYNTVYDRYGGISIYESFYSDTNLSTSYWYADSIVWDSDTRKYHLINPYQVSSTDDYVNLSGKYTFGNSSQTYVDNYVKYIAAVDGTRYYYIGIDNGRGLEYYNSIYTYGDSYTDNGNGTYTINNASTINRVDWFSNYESLNNKYFCKNASNNTCNKVMYSTTTQKDRFLYVNPLNYYVYANGFSYANGKYTLNNDRVAFWDYNDTTNRNSLSTHHYSCFNTSGECETIKYVISAGGGTEQAYIELTDGKSIYDAMNEMFYNDDVNQKNSTIKKGVDEWYRHYLINYSDYLEDVVFCGDRVQINQDTSSWYPNGNILEYDIKFYEGLYRKNGLNCANITDQYCVSNSKAQLTYKVALMTYNEALILNSFDLRKNGYNYFLLTPMNYDKGNNVWSVSSNGNMSLSQGNGTLVSSGVRPVISLMPGTIYTSGDGSMANPYVVSTN